MLRYALVRTPAPTLARGITSAALGTPDVALCLQQHDAYVAALGDLGLQVTVLDADRAFPDGHFVEDPAVVTPELAIITRPGASARRGEAAALEPLLNEHRPLRRIAAPGTVDGGDVLILGKRCFVGLSQRTNQSGGEQLEAVLRPFGYTTVAVAVSAGLHLKSGVNAIGAEKLLVNASLAEHPALDGLDKLVVPGSEAYAANTLWINDTLLMPAGFPHTAEMLRSGGYPVIELEVSEMRKMDGGLTCLSLRF